MKKITLLFTALVLLGVTMPASSQHVVPVDLADVVKKGDVELQNRTVKPLNSKTHKGVNLNAKEGAGMLWLKGDTFQNGTIEVDVRGRNTPGRSFVGVAFHEDGNGVYEVIYLRPFNFRNEARRSNAVQYSYEPDYGWRRLREEHPGKYESAVEPAPDPEGWVHMRLEIDGNRVQAFINDIETPVLEVDRISKATAGRIGLWVGNGSEGDFANLKITQK